MQGITVTVENLTEEGGIYLAPFWAGFHNGNFDTFNSGEAASVEVERLAEDGNLSPLMDAFDAAQPDGTQGVLLGLDGVPGPFDPGEEVSMSFNIDDPAAARYFSYAAMAVPSNDAFVGNDDPDFLELFDVDGNYLGDTSFYVYGGQIWDAGTEDNTEMDAAFINQMAPDTGVTTMDGVVMQHPGFNGSMGNPGSMPVNILGGTTAAGTTVTPEAGDFTQADFEFLKISIFQNMEMDGGRGDDLLEGSGGYDILSGGRGDDTLGGHSGNDTLYGNRGDDVLHGGAGHDMLHGGRGDDLLEGGDGDDVLNGGRGDDTLTGGEGSDLFHFDRHHGEDVVTDFGAEDYLFFESNAFDTAQEVLDAFTYAGGDAMLDYKGGELLLEGVDHGDLTTDQILLA